MSERAAPDPAAQMDLLGSSPRPVRLAAGGFVLAVLAAALFAAAVFVAVWMPGVAARDAERRARFESEAVAAEAEITAIGPRRGKDSRRTVTYRFSAAGRDFTRRQSLRRSAWRGLEAGARVPVRYLPSDPSVSYIRGGPGGLPLWAVPALALPLLLAAAAIGWAIRRDVRLLAEGRPALARVTASKPAHKGRLRAHYEFRNLSGALVPGSYEASKPVPPGTALVVLYDREKDRKSVV